MALASHMGCIHVSRLVFLGYATTTSSVKLLLEESIREQRSPQNTTPNTVFENNALIQDVPIRQQFASRPDHRRHFRLSTFNPSASNSIEKRFIFYFLFK